MNEESNIILKIFIVLLLIVITIMAYEIRNLSLKVQKFERSQYANSEIINQENESQKINENEQENVNYQNITENKNIIALEKNEESIIKKCDEYLNCTSVIFDKASDLTDDKILKIIHKRLYNLNDVELLEISDAKNGNEPAFTKDRINELSEEMFGIKIKNFNSNLFTIKDNILIPKFSDGDPEKILQGMVYKITDDKIVVDYTADYLVAGDTFASSSDKVEYFEATFSKNENSITFVSKKKILEKDILVYDTGKVPKLLGSSNLSSGNIDIPYINLKTEEANNLNKEIQDKYSKMEAENNELINDIRYKAYVNNDVLSLVINEKIYYKSDDKFEENQQIYNFNLN